MADKQAANLEVFRKALEDALAIMEGVTPFCQTLEEGLGIARLAIENEGQMKLLIAAMEKKR